MNVDNVRSQEAINDAINNLEENDIDIARIQDARNESINKIEYTKYIIYCG